MTIADKTVLVTGANRGIGQALVAEALTRGAKRVYAGTRQPLARPDPRVTPLTLDVTNAAQTQAAVESVESLDLLINNAGLALYDDWSDRAPGRRDCLRMQSGQYRLQSALCSCSEHCFHGNQARSYIGVRRKSQQGVSYR